MASVFNFLAAALFGPQREIILLVGGFHDVQIVNLFLLLEMFGSLEKST